MPVEADPLDSRSIEAPNRLDVTGQRIEVGDLVRVLGVPDLGGMSARARRESTRVFEHIRGPYK